MPYSSLKKIPKSVQKHLPLHAQEMNRKAFNNAWEEYAETIKRSAKISREAIAHKVAWAAVKLKYVKQGGNRVSKSLH